MMEERIHPSDLKRENRQLRQAFETLLEEIEKEGPTDCDCVRDEMPDNWGEKNPIEPPWEREGYDEKEEWLEKKRGNGKRR